MKMRSTFQRDIALEGATIYKYQANLSETKRKSYKNSCLAFLVQCTRAKFLCIFHLVVMLFFFSRCVRCPTTIRLSVDQWLIIPAQHNHASMRLSLIVMIPKHSAKQNDFIYLVFFWLMCIHSNAQQIPAYQTMRHETNNRNTQKRFGTF